MANYVKNNSQKALEEVWEWRKKVQEDYAGCSMLERARKMAADADELVEKLGLKKIIPKGKRPGKDASLQAKLATGEQ